MSVGPSSSEHRRNPQRLALEECRAYLETQVSMLQHTDGKAMSIVRLNVLFIGLSVAILSISDGVIEILQQSIALLIVTGGANVSFIISIVLALVSYGIDSPQRGIRFMDWKSIPKGTEDTPMFYDALLREYIAMIRFNEGEIRKDKAWLARSQFIFLFGIGLLVGAFLWALAPISPQTVYIEVLNRYI